MANVYPPGCLYVLPQSPVIAAWGGALQAKRARDDSPYRVVVVGRNFRLQRRVPVHRMRGLFCTVSIAAV